MFNSTNTDRLVRWQGWAVRLCLIGFVVSVVTLAAWTVDVPGLTPLVLGTHPRVALALVAAASALWLQLQVAHLTAGSASRIGRLSAGLAGFTIVLAVATLLEKGTGADIGLERIFVSQARAASAPPISSLAAIGLLGLGAAVFLVRWEATIVAAQLLACVVVMIAWTSVAGTLYNVEALRLDRVDVGTELPPVLVFLVLGPAILLSNPNTGLAGVYASSTAGGSLARPLLIPIALLPVLVNWVELMGERRGWYPEGVGWVLDAVVTVASVAVLVSWAAFRLHRSDAERLKAVEALRESEERYRRLLETSPDAVLIKDRHRIQLANTAALQLLGASDAKQVAGKSPYAFVHPDDRPRIETHLCRLLDTGGRFPITEQRLLRIDGTAVDVELTASAVDVRGHRLAQVIARDITERKRHSLALRENEERVRLSEQRFRATFEQAAVGMSHVSQDGRITRVNPRLCEILGYRAEELTSRPFEDVVHPEDRAAERRQRLRLASGEIQTSTIQIRHVRSDGSTVSVESTVSIVRKHAGPEYFLVVTQDISERRALQEQLLQVQRLEVIGQLAGGLAHDFNNLLTIIHGQASFLAEDERVPSEHREGARDVVAAAERAGALTRKLLLVGRRQVMQPRQLDLNTVVGDLRSVLARLIPEDIELQFTIDPRPCHVHADPAMLEQILLNLAVNARDAMPAGGRLTIATTRTVFGPEIVQLNPEAQPGEYVGVVVSDTGTGIPPELMPRVFEPFFSTKPPSEHSGLGLATVLAIVKQHGGGVTVESPPGQGATFLIWLPESDAPRETRERDAARDPFSTRGTETILIAEDDPFVRTFTRRALEREGYRVLEATNGDEALDVWRKHREGIHLIITDVVMPGGISGREFAAQVKRDAPGFKMIVTSGYSVDLAGIKLQLDAGEYFLEKPFTPRRLIELVRKSLDDRPM